MIAVNLDGIGKCYGRRWAAREVTLSLASGECLALLGHNGAGKTTLMKLILGLVKPDAGRLTVLGGAPGDAGSPVRRMVGFLPENVAFHDAMTGQETLDFYARLKGRSGGECRRLLELVGLAAAAGRRVATYSKGMRQRLGLAQALLGNPRLLLLDEPTSGLDPALRQSFYAIIRGLAADGAAVLLSSHLLTELERRTDRIAVMDDGRLRAVGTVDDLRRNSGLPLRIRLAVADDRVAAVLEDLAMLSPQSAAGFGLEISCPLADKMAVLRRVLALGPLVADVDIIEPGLDAVYAGLAGGEAA